MPEGGAVNSLVRAAGGVVVRLRSPGAPEVAVVHRARYDDWTLPKGKLEPGESEEDAAIREVEEETGLRCRLLRYLDTVRYSDRHGRPKSAAYWLMVPVTGDLRPDHEIDDARWVPPDEVASLLTYPRDSQIVAEALDAFRHVSPDPQGSEPGPVTLEGR